jgi:hypothetical protein
VCCSESSWMLQLPTAPEPAQKQPKGMNYPQRPC